MVKWYKTRLGRWLVGDAVALDELGNTVLLQGNPHETISAHCGSQIQAGDPCLFCTAVCWFIQRILGRLWPSLRTHCRDTWKAERAMVVDTRNLGGVDPSRPGGP